MSIDAQNDLAKIRRARDGSTEEPEDAPEIFTCPIEGCSRTMIDDAGALRNHVTQESDEAHRHRTLDENLEVVVQWETMNWGWGAPK